MAAYYNEIDPYAAAWLRNLIAKGLIAPGDVDERSIEDVCPSDLIGYTQCHFFAGIGVWSHALRSVGWDDERPVWTGSCPCQPFSAAGKGDGFADERHLWPAFHHLIRELRPARVFGEQVASKDADPWIDLVQTDLEAVGYRVGAVPFPAAGIGAPHIRDRLYWVADSECVEREERVPGLGKGNRKERGGQTVQFTGLCLPGRLDHPHHHHQGLEGQRGGHQAEGRHGQGTIRPVAEAGESGGVANTNCERSGEQRRELCKTERRSVGMGLSDGGRASETSGNRTAGPTNGHWRDADWLFCRDGKWRPVEPGAFPLAHGATGRVGRLRAYGNAIVAQAAAAFIVASEEAQLWL